MLNKTETLNWIKEYDNNEISPDTLGHIVADDLTISSKKIGETNDYNGEIPTLESAIYQLSLADGTTITTYLSLGWDSDTLYIK